MALYKIIEQDSEGNALTVQNTETGACIPADEGNADYRAFLAWVAAGNTPDPME